jgi:hypothetical protein
MKPRNATINPKAQMARAEAKSRQRVEREQQRRQQAAAARAAVQRPETGGR